MKLALEALENLTRYDMVRANIFRQFHPTATGDYVNLQEFREKAKPVITALREALAEQPVKPYRQLQDNGSKYFGESWDKAEQPAQQEPVANYCRECLTYNGHHEGCSHYASPPAQRTWVGLEKSDMPTDPNPMYDHKYFTAGMVYAANKLMEKNT